MPDQQAGTGPDPLEVADEATKSAGEEQPGPDAEIPDTDEAGTGRRGAPHSASASPEHPVPDEPSG
ncbi:hypothetical protein ABZT45_47290 [Streptomyces sp. NPDC005356]|uniref:hypothetical protein n=1 Tax=unclassified Streptomyces TaxID=2593676 RepID=UPI0033A1421A